MKDVHSCVMRRIQGSQCGFPRCSVYIIITDVIFARHSSTTLPSKKAPQVGLCYGFVTEVISVTLNRLVVCSPLPQQRVCHAEHDFHRLL